MDGDDEREGQGSPERPWWLREDRELSVAAHARSSRVGQREIGPYLRTITKTEVAVTGAVCGAEGRREGYPGARMRYCSDTCRAEAARRSAAARMRQMRARCRPPSASP